MIADCTLAEAVARMLSICTAAAVVVMVKLTNAVIAASDCCLNAVAGVATGIGVSSIVIKSLVPLDEPVAALVVVSGWAAAFARERAATPFQSVPLFANCCFM